MSEPTPEHDAKPPVAPIEPNADAHYIDYLRENLFVAEERLEKAERAIDTERRASAAAIVRAEHSEALLVWIKAARYNATCDCGQCADITRALAGIDKEGEPS